MNEKQVRDKAKSLFGTARVLPPCWSDKSKWGSKKDFEKWCDEAALNIIEDWLKELEALGDA